VNPESPREIAAQVLRRRRNSPDYIELLLETGLARSRLSRLDRALCQELVYGVARWEMTLDWLIARKTGGRPQEEVPQLLLRLGLYQIFWLQRIPAHAAVNETVEMAKRLCGGRKTGFLNAVLRGCLREREEIVRQLQSLKQQDPATGYSHPAWLVERWQARWGTEKTAQLLEWNNTPPPVFARLNRLKTDAATLTQRWKEQGIGFAARQWDWTAQDPVFELQSHPSLAEWEDFQRGLFYVQDPSTLLAVHELDPQPGENILDFCASPGGKTTHIAQRMDNRGHVVAQDLPPRLLRLRENCERLGAACVEITEQNTPLSPVAAVCDRRASEGARFDRVLLDAPCSNSGVLRRRIDGRWRIQPEPLARLRRAQGMLLRQAAAQLKPGGRLVYSTCSLEPEENESVTAEFLGEHPEFTLESQRQLLPFADQVDGAFVAVMRCGESLKGGT
jgi:16S rRNA (cytosine967-C5)-methyltransferase